MNKKIITCLIILFIFNVNATSNYIENNKINTLVEFFSFTCKHCANVNEKLVQYISSNHIKYLDINIDDNPSSIYTTIMYYIAVDAGVGVEFKNIYFKAIAMGMTAYSQDTLLYVFKKLNNPIMIKLLNSTIERERIKKKMNYAKDLMTIYKIRVTPSFLINQTTLLEGEDIINSLGDSNEK
jgi:hypothetical protein